MNLSNVDVIDFLQTLGIRNVTDSGEEIQFSCPFGHMFGDENPSAYMNRDTTAFFCHGCKEKGNAVHFLAKYEGIGPVLAATYLRERYDVGFLEPSATLVGELEELWQREEVIVSYNPTIDYKLSLLEDIPLDYMLNRKFCANALSHWGVGYDSISDRIAIPVTDEYNHLIGFKARSYKEGHNPKYLALGDTKRHRYGFRPYEVSRVLFGLYNSLLSPGDGVVIVEGEFNVIALWQYGVKNAVALSGSHFSDYQRDLILAYFDHVTVFVDSDRAGQSVSAEIVDKLFPYIKVSLVAEHEGDPASLSAEACYKIISGAVAVTELWANNINE